MEASASLILLASSDLLEPTTFLISYAKSVRLRREGVVPAERMDEHTHSYIHFTSRASATRNDFQTASECIRASQIIFAPITQNGQAPISLRGKRESIMKIMFTNPIMPGMSTNEYLEGRENCQSRGFLILSRRMQS